MHYIIVVTKYLTKWVEAKVIKSADARQIAIFFYENIISQFGCLKILIDDQGSHLLNDAIVDLMKLFNINHRKTTPYHPQINGLTKKVNQIVIRILHKIMMDSKWDWDHKLTTALWAYKTTYKVSIRTNPFSFVFGVKAILPVEFEIPSLRITIYERLDNHWRIGWRGLKA